MTKGILGIIGGLILAAGLQAQVGGGGFGRAGGGVAIPIEQFQQAGTMAVVADGRGGSNVLNGNPNQTVIGRPFSGTEVQKSTQTLGDGTEISTSESQGFYRDSAGRTRREMREGRTVIVDPVAHVTVTLNAATKTARKMAMPAVPVLTKVGVAFSDPQLTTSNTYTVTVGDGTTTVTAADEVIGGRANTTASITAAAAATGARAGRGNAENMQHEELGVLTMNGVTASGTRNTRTIPQGQIGNNRDIHVVNERWYSDDLQMLVKTVNSDPRFGENTYELTNISRDEPDASLFQIPAGYTVIEGRQPTAPPTSTNK